MKKKVLLMLFIGLLSIGGTLIADSAPCDCYFAAKKSVPGTAEDGLWCYSAVGDPCGETQPCSVSTGSCLAFLCASPCLTGSTPE